MPPDGLIRRWRSVRGRECTRGGTRRAALTWRPAAASGGSPDWRPTSSDRLQSPAGPTRSAPTATRWAESAVLVLMRLTRAPVTPSCAATRASQVPRSRATSRAIMPVGSLWARSKAAGPRSAAAAVGPSDAPDHVGMVARATVRRRRRSWRMAARRTTALRAAARRAAARRSRRALAGAASG
jgi:hypothetical protein